MIDIHCHALAGVDDGAESFEVSVTMCKMAAADGISHLVATPHSDYHYELQPELNRNKLAELQAAVGETPKLLLGCDFHLSYENLQRLPKHRADFTINGGNYLLVELAEMFVPQQIEQVFYEIQLAGLNPILTHPERNRIVRGRPELVSDWVGRGVLVQLTAQSYTGSFGREAKHFSELWLEQGLVHFFATDAHDLKHRPPILSACYQKLFDARGKEMAELLLVRNPEAVIQGLPLPPGPQPAAPGERPQKKQGWLARRLFQREGSR